MRTGIASYRLTNVVPSSRSSFKVRQNRSALPLVWVFRDSSIWAFRLIAAGMDSLYN